MIKTYDPKPEHVCTKQDPYRREITCKVRHPDAAYQRDKDWGDGVITAEYHCPNCGLNFSVEIAQ